MASSGVSSPKFDDKLKSFVQTLNSIKSNNKTPNWIKPLLDSMKTFATDVATHVEQLHSTTEVSKRVSSQLEASVKSLTDDLDDLQQYSRRTCLLIHGVAEEESENVEAKVFDVIKKEVKADLETKDVSRTHRLGKKRTDNKPRPIIVRFLSYRQRKQVFDKKKALKGKKIVITENLTKSRYTLLQKCKDFFEKENVWTYDGRICCKHNEKKLVFTNIGEFEDFCSEDQ